MAFSATARLRRFARCSRGNLAIIFGASLLPIAATMGAAVDFASAEGARVRLQAAADAAALAATRNYGKSWQVRQQIATDTFNANLAGVGGADNVSFNIVDQGQSHKVDAAATLETAFMELVGIDDITIKVDAEAISPQASLEVVLVLDNTGSMSSSNKISVLRQSAENFVDMMEMAAGIPGKTIKVGLVPFTTMVRVDPSHSDADWLDLEESSSSGGSSGSGGWSGWGWGGWGGWGGSSGGGSSSSTWKGCIYDRVQPYDTNDTPPDTDDEDTLFPPDPDNGFSSSDCDMAKVHELSNDFSSLRDNIDDMRAEGNTNITLGVVWGLHILSGSEPFTQGAPWSEVETTKVMIVLTDGENTQSRWSSNTNSIDARTRMACDTVKAKDVLVYTVRVVNGDADLLRDCATDDWMYTDIRRASDLTATFEKLAADIINRHLRLTM